MVAVWKGRMKLTLCMRLIAFSTSAFCENAGTLNLPYIAKIIKFMFSPTNWS